jgi:hypothetical protein
MLQGMMGVFRAGFAMPGGGEEGRRPGAELGGRTQ